MKKLLIIALIGFCSITTYGQSQQNKHEFSVWGAGGISSLQYDPVIGDNSLGLGGFAGLGYSYFFHYNWGISIGAEYSILNGKTKMPLFTENYYTPSTNSEYIYHMFVDGKNFEQTHTANYINIPLMVKFVSNEIGNGKRFYAAAGAKVGIPVKGSYKSKGSMTTKGWEVDDNGDYFTNDPYVNMPHHGFGTYQVSSKKEDIDFKTNVMLSLEAGMKWRLKSNNKWFLYTGLYLDYGLSDVRDEGNSAVYAYNPKSPSKYTMNSIFESEYDGASFTDKVNTLSAGIKVQLTFGSNLFSKKTKAPVVEAEKPYPGLTAAQADEIISRSTDRLINAKKDSQPQTVIVNESGEISGSITGFDLNKAIILPVMYPELDRVIEEMRKQSSVKLLLEGNTDDLGSNELNYDLGLKRAEAVKEYMVARGINPNRLAITSKGKNNPFIPNSDEAKRRANRRVDVSQIK